MNDFKEERLSEAKRKNRSSSMGELRIIASIKVGKDITGFIVMVERTGQTKPYTYGQVLALLDRYVFVNACKKNDKVQILDSAIDRLPATDVSLRLVDYTANYIIIKTEIYNKNVFVGYRAIIFHSNGVSFFDLDEEQLIALVKNKGYKLVNAKLVHRDTKYIISALKGEFFKEEIATKELHQATKADSKNIGKDTGKENRKLYRYNRHTEKLRSAAPLLFEIIVCKQNKGCEDIILRRLSRKLGVVSNKQLSKEKELNILIDETLATNKGLKKDLVAIRKVVDNDKVPFVVKAAMVLQYFYKDGDIDLDNVSVKSLNIVNKLKDLGVARPDVLKMIKDVTERADRLGEITKRDRTQFEETTFKKASQIAELGFAISKNNEGIRYKTKCGSVYKLKYIGNYIPEYEKYKNGCTSFGDIMSLAVIEKSLNSYLDDGPTKQVYLARVEIALCMLAFYNFDLAKRYYTETLKNRLESNNIIETGINFEKFVDLDPNLKNKFELYYTSGYCVTENIGRFLHTRRAEWSLDYLNQAKYINIRQSLSILTPAIFEVDAQNMICAVINTNALQSDAVTISNTFGLMRVM